MRTGPMTRGERIALWENQGMSIEELRGGETNAGIFARRLAKKVDDAMKEAVRRTWRVARMEGQDADDVAAKARAELERAYGVRF